MNRAAPLFAVLLAWRILARPASELWQDVPLVVALGCAGLVWPRLPDLRLPAACWLLGLYVAAQAPRILEVFGWR